MHCKTCDYPLWNITSNKCPECGEAFCPSEYEFVPNSVRFCCPNCQQTYFGTNPKGHLEPADFACVNCSNQIHMDQMVLLPAEGVEENWTKPAVNPWLERKTRGLFKAWFASVIGSLGRQTTMMKALGDSVRLGEAWKFALFNLAIILSISVVLPGLIVVLFQYPWIYSGQLIDEFSFYGFTFVIYALIYVVIIILWAASAHGILRLTKSANYKFGKTLEAILYSSGVMSLAILPYVGVFCITWPATIWWIISSVIMVSVGQKAHGGRTSLAVITFPAIAYILTIASYVGFTYYMVSQMNMAFSSGMMQGMSGNSTQGLTIDILSITQNPGSKSPAHSILLIENPNSTGITFSGRWITSEDQFVGSTTSTLLEDIPVGDLTLAEFQLSSATIRKAAVQDLLDSMPEDIVAHRFGDYVFTYHGANISNPNQGLWIVVYLPDPDVNVALQPNDMIEVGLANWTTYQFTADQLDAELEGQNKLRANLGLPPLPDLTTVTHSNPAVAVSEDSSD